MGTYRLRTDRCGSLSSQAGALGDLSGASPPSNWTAATTLRSMPERPFRHLDDRLSLPLQWPRTNRRRDQPLTWYTSPTPGITRSLSDSIIVSPGQRFRPRRDRGMPLVAQSRTGAGEAGDGGGARCDCGASAARAQRAHLDRAGLNACASGGVHSARHRAPVLSAAPSGHQNPRLRACGFRAGSSQLRRSFTVSAVGAASGGVAVIATNRSAKAADEHFNQERQIAKLNVATRLTPLLRRFALTY